MPISPLCFMFSHDTDKNKMHLAESPNLLKATSVLLTTFASRSCCRTFISEQNIHSSSAAWFIRLYFLQHEGPFKMRIYERANFEGQMQELTDDCDSIQDQYQIPEMQSCNVMEGYWLIFEQPNYEGRMFYLRPGEYRNLKEMTTEGKRFNSTRRITES